MKILKMVYHVLLIMIGLVLIIAILIYYFYRPDLTPYINRLLPSIASSELSDSTITKIIGFPLIMYGLIPLIVFLLLKAFLGKRQKAYGILFYYVICLLLVGVFLAFILSSYNLPIFKLH